MATQIDTDLPFSVGVVNSEISSDVDVGVDVAADLGMSGIEIEDFWGRAAWQVDDALLERTRASVERGGLSVSAVGTQAFKILILPPGDARDLASIDGWDQHRIELEGGIRVAQALDSPFVRVFSCRRDGMVGMGNPSPRLPEGGPLPADRLAGIAAVLRDAGDRADAAGVTLLVEKRPQLLGQHGREHRAHPGSHRSPEGQAELGSVQRLRLRRRPFSAPATRLPVRGPPTSTSRTRASSIPSTGLIAWECVGRGEVDFVGQLRALIADGFAGAVNLETHWHPEDRSKEANSRESFAGMLHALDLARSDGA